MIKGFIFDLDGVLVDTAKYHYLAWKRLCDELGFHFDRKDNELLKGVSRTRSMEIILSLNNKTLTGDEIAALCEKKNRYYRDFIKTLGSDELLPGVEEFLSEAETDGYLCAIGSASKNCPEIVDRLGIRPRFQSIIDGTKVTKAKPDPEVFVKAAQELGLDNNECIVFEDSLAGILAAGNCRMKSVGVGNSELIGHCDYFIKGFECERPRKLVDKTEGK